MYGIFRRDLDKILFLELQEEFINVIYKRISILQIGEIYKLWQIDYWVEGCFWLYGFKIYLF